MTEISGRQNAPGKPEQDKLKKNNQVKWHYVSMLSDINKDIIMPDNS